MEMLGLIFLISVLINPCRSSFSSILPSNAMAEGAGPWCQSWKNLVCGSDGVTYWNECMYLKSRDKNPELEMLMAGPCDVIDCTAECGKQSEKLHICTAGNLLIDSVCSLKCIQEEFPLIKEDYLGCRSYFPSPEEMERANPKHFVSMMENFLGQAFSPFIKPPARGSTSANSMKLKPFRGFLQKGGSTFKISAKRGWMNIISISTSNIFYLSTEKPGRLKFRLVTDSLQTGYDNFMLIADGKRVKAPTKVRLDNSTMMLTMDLFSNKLNCTRVLPVEVRLLEFPTVNITLRSANFQEKSIPLHDLQGLMKEKIVRKINEAILDSFFIHMRRVGCLSWAKKGEDKCFGALQTRYCSQ